MEVSIGEANFAHPFDVIGKQTWWELFPFRLCIRKISYPASLWGVITWEEATTNLFLILTP